MNILFAGDYCPYIKIGSSNKEEAINYDDIKSVIETVDFSLVNLECPAADSLCKGIDKIGPNLSCTANSIEEIKNMGFSGVTLANNHIYDYGKRGLKLTLETLEKNGLCHVGADTNIKKASDVLYKEIESKRIAFINCCEREFSIADDNRGGAMPLDIVKIYYLLEKTKKESDYIILIIHGGIEQYQNPSPRMVETYRMFVDFGANVIINHHQHCFCGYEIYKGCPIFYGLGNFYFKPIGKHVPQSWYSGYMVMLQIEDGIIDFKIVPYFQNKIEGKISLLNKKEEMEFDKEIMHLNGIIAKEDDLHTAYNNLLKTSSYNIISPFSNRYLQACVRRGFLPSFIPRKVLRNLYNKITCDSHRDRFLAFLESRISDD